MGLGVAQRGFERTLAAIREDGFDWEEFQDIFPFSFLDIGEGEYVQLVNAVLDQLPDDVERTVLLNLLDIQWNVYVEQLWVAHEFGNDPKRFAGESHFALARLQIDSNIRLERGLPRKDGRRAMMNLGKQETLKDRMLVTGSSAVLPAGSPGEILVNVNGSVWSASSVVQVGAYGDHAIDISGKPYYNRRDPFNYDGLLSTPFYIIGDSITSPSGGGILRYTLTTDSGGSITAVGNSTTDTGWVRDFTLVHRGINESYAWFDVAIGATGGISSITLRTQAGAMEANLLTEPYQQNSTYQSWAYNLWNRYALNGDIDAMQATSYAVPGTSYVFQGVAASPGQIALVVLGGNDAGNIDLGSGLNVGGTTATVTVTSLAAACQALYTALQAAGYRVIVCTAPYNDFDQLTNEPDWITATDLVNEGIYAACANLGITEIWDFVTPVLEDGLHPSFDGADLITQGLYPRMVAVSSGCGGSGDYVDLVSDQIIRGKKRFSELVQAQSLVSDTNIAAVNYPAGNGDLVGIGGFNILSNSEAPKDGDLYARQNGAWVPVPTSSGGPGVAAAGGRITSDGSGAQNISGCFGIASCSIVSNQFEITLSSPIATNQMIVTASGGVGLAAIMCTTNVTSTTTFTVAVLVEQGGKFSLYSGAGLLFNFNVHNAGRTAEPGTDHDYERI